MTYGEGICIPVQLGFISGLVSGSNWHGKPWTVGMSSRLEEEKKLKGKMYLGYENRTAREAHSSLGSLSPAARGNCHTQQVPRKAPTFLCPLGQKSDLPFRQRHGAGAGSRTKEALGFGFGERWCAPGPMVQRLGVHLWLLWTAEEPKRQV